MICVLLSYYLFFFFFQAEDGIRYVAVTGVQTCALPIFSFVRDVRMGCTSRAKLTCATPGMQVSRSLSRSRLPPEDAVTVRCALPGLIPASESLSGKPSPGGVQL